MARKYLVNGAEVLAIVINPKTRELVEVHREADESVKLHYPGRYESLGEAYYDESETYEFNGDDYVRSHSPGSGVRKGQGFGVALYSGLCLRAYSDVGVAGIASSDGGTGHETRSVDADRFWRRCANNGLAEDAVAYGSEEREYSLDGSDYFEYSCDIVPDEECEQVEDVDGLVNVTYTVGADADAQYMPAEHVAQAQLIFSLPGMREKLDFPAPTPEVLASLNLQHCYDVGLAEMLIESARRAGFDLAYIDRLVSTLPKDVYQQTSASKQMKFGFVANRSQDRAQVRRDVDRVWRDTYGGLADI